MGLITNKVDFLKQLKVPTFETDPVTRPVEGLEDFYNSITYSDNDFARFVAVVQLSINDITLPPGLDDDETSKYLKEGTRAINEIIAEVDIQRRRRNRWNSLASRRATAFSTESEALSKDVSDRMEETFRNIHTWIGPVQLGTEMPIVDVQITENYDARVARTVRSITDPVIRDHNNDITMQISIEVPQESLNPVFKDDGSFLTYGLQGLLATLKAAPIVEISSAAIVPVYVNSLLAPELFQRVRDEVVGKVLATQGTNAATYQNEKLALLGEDFIAPENTIENPTGSPAHTTFPLYKVVSYEGAPSGVEDGDGIWVVPEPNTLNVEPEQLRFMGINSPEMNSATRNVPAGKTASTRAPAPGALESTAALEKLHPVNSFVRVDTSPGRGYFGRQLAYVYSETTGKMSGRSIEGFKQFVGSLNPFVDYMVGDRTGSNGIAPVVDPIPDTDKSSRLSNLDRNLITVACAFQGAVVETQDNQTNTLLVKLFFRRFNENVWQDGKIRYRDSNGDMTPNVQQAVWIPRLAQKMFMSASALDSGLEYMEPYQTSFGEEEAGMTFKWEDPAHGDIREFAPSGKDFVVTHVESRFFMKMATLPLLGSVYPVVQYMGVDNVHAFVTIETTDAVTLAKFHEMKSELDAAVYQSGAPYHRRQFITIKNNVLNFLGARDFAISGVSTYRNAQEEKWVIELELLENRLSFQLAESIVLASKGKGEQNDVRTIWNHIYDLLNDQVEFNTKELSRPQRDFYSDKLKVNWYKTRPVDPNKPKKSELDGEGAFAYELVFGDDSRGVNSIIQPNILAAAWFYLTQKKKNGVRHVLWDTRASNDRTVAAVLEGAQFEDASIFELDPTNRNGLLNPISYVVSQTGGYLGTERRLAHGNYNPASIFNFSAQSNTGYNRIREGDEDQDFSLSRIERIAQGKANNFLSKGQYERPEGAESFDPVQLALLSPAAALADHLGFPTADFFETLTGDSAQLNIKEQGREMLRWMAIDGRKDVFFAKELWDAYFDIVFGGRIYQDQSKEPAWTSSDVRDARQRLLGLLRTGAYENFPTLGGKAGLKLESLQDTVRETNVNVDQRAMEDVPGSEYKPITSNYADMNLPTYAALFGRKAVDADSKELWRKFAPTYGDLGIKPPYHRAVAYEDAMEAQAKTPRRINDPVDPDLPYFHKRLKPETIAAASEKEDALDRALGEYLSPKYMLKPIPNEIAALGTRGIDQFLKQIWKPLSQRSADPRLNGRENDHLALHAVNNGPVVGDEKPTLSLLVIDEKGNHLGNVVSGGRRPKFVKAKGGPLNTFSGDALSVFDPYDKEHITRTNRDLLARVNDKTLSMGKLFPAYRLYFIDKDRGVEYLSDDLYGVNSLISLSVRIDKEDAALLTCQLSNVTHNLSNEEILTRDSQDKLGLNVDDAGEGYFSKLKLQTGITVQLRLGYGSLPEDMDIIFTGMITEIMPGNVVSLVAQGHKRELLNEVQFEMESINHLDIIRKVLEKTETPHLGEGVGVREISEASMRAIVTPGQDPSASVGFVDYVMNKKLVNMTNVHVTSNARLEADRRVFIKRDLPLLAITDIGAGIPILNAFNDEENPDSMYEGFRNYLWAHTVDPLLELATEMKPDAWWIDTAYSGGKWAKWIIPPQSAWDAIKEVARHRPGAIAQVVPFETDGTLFVGQPEQPYMYREPGHVEQLTYARLNPVLNKKESRIDFQTQLIVPFLSSVYVAMYRGHFGGTDTENFSKAQGKYARALEDNSYFVGEDIFSSNDDASLFLRHEDILELDELPDGDDKAEFLDILYDRTFVDRGDFYEKARGSFIQDRVSVRLPAGFNIETHWWVYANNMKDTVVKEFRQIDPTLLENLFFWYYDIDPQKGVAVLAGAARDLEQMFAEPGLGIFDTFKEKLEHDPNGLFNTEYKRLTNDTPAIFGSQAPREGGYARQIDTLVNSGVMTKKQGDALKVRAEKNRNRTLVRRSTLMDPFENAITDFPANASVADVLLETGGGFRLFCWNVYLWIKSEEVNRTLNKAKLRDASRKMRIFDLPPGYRVFRDYHLIGNKDLIANNLTASMSEMSNCILLRAPASEVEYHVNDSKDVDGNEDEEDIMIQYEDTDWRSYPTTDGIPFTYKIGKENRKLGVTYELNAIHPNQKAKTIMTNMGQLLQPMYRGSITIIGRSIKPHDVIYLQDDQNDLRGHFEVASVIHHFNVSQGWISEIEPHTLVRVNNPTSEMQLTSMQGVMRDMGAVLDLLDAGLLIFSIAGFVLPFVGPAAAFGTRAASAIAGGITRYGQKALATEAAKSSMKTGFGTFFKWAGASVKEAFGSGTAGAAGQAAKWAGGRSLSMANWLGKNVVTPGGFKALTGLWGVANLGDLATSLYVKHQLNSTELPIDVHMLLYRGQNFQAGIETSSQDMYSIFDKFAGLGGDIRKDVEKFIVNVADDFSRIGDPFSRGNQYDRALDRSRR